MIWCVFSNYAKIHFDELQNLSLVSARCQTAGVGRLGRKWISAKDRDITATAVLKEISDGFHAGIICGLAVLTLIRQMTPDSISFFKWPNDIYIGNRKLCGILSEGIIRNRSLAGVVCGMGINVNSSFEELQHAGQPATSLSIESGSNFDIIFLTEKLENLIRRCYIKSNSDFQSVFELWKRENRLIGNLIEVVDPTGTRFTGVFRDIDSSGAMLMQCGSREKIFSCGDVKIDITGTDWDVMRQAIRNNGDALLKEFPE